MRFNHLVRVGIPQVLTGSRIAFGAAAIIAVSHGNAHLAATLITLGAVTDGLDGPAARWLGGGTTFGIWFDYFSDYVCYIIAPWVLSRLLLPDAGALVEGVLAIPLVTGAIRYARNGLALNTGGPQVPELPGLGTVFYAFVPVTAVFLDAPPAAFAWGPGVFVGMIVTFAVLMNVPLRFPKLATARWASPAVLVLLAVQPFWMTRPIAAATLVIGVGYVLAAAVRPRVVPSAHAPHVSSTARQPCPLERMKRSRSGQSGRAGSTRITSK